jgi:hypothetical protein
VIRCRAGNSTCGFSTQGRAGSNRERCKSKQTMIGAGVPYIDGFWPDTIFACLCLYSGLLCILGNSKLFKAEKRSLTKKLGFVMFGIGVVLLIYALSEYKTSN